MATRAFNKLVPAQGAVLPTGVVVYEWTGLLNGDDGTPVAVAAYPEKCVEVAGTFGVGGSVQAQGSLKVDLPADADFVPLNDPQGGVVALTTSNKIEQILETPYWFRPKVTAGDGTTSLTVRLFVSTIARR